MKGRKARREKQRRAGSLPPCYGECGRCFLQNGCEFYEEWKADQIKKANEREEKLRLSLIDEEWARDRVN